MDRLAFNAAAAINEGRTARQMTTNELANVATPGFKRSFEAAMLTLKVKGAGFESRLQPQAFSTDNINMRPGVIVKTGRELDIAMDEQAVMGVTAKNGELAFTRRGDLKGQWKRCIRNGYRRFGSRSKWRSHYHSTWVLH